VDRLQLERPPNSSADQSDLKVISVSGGQPRNLTADLDYSISNIEWSKDGKFLYFITTEGLTSKLYKVAASGGKPTPIAFGDGFVVSDFTATDDGSKWLVTGATMDDGNVVLVSGADGAQPKRIFEDHDRMNDFNIARSQTLSWKGADNWDIDGILTYPLNYQAGQKYPLILQVHGGPFGRYAATFNSGAQIWAARGYAVLQGNPRGSSGRTFAFGAANQNDWGGKDFIDLMKGVDHVVAMGVADTAKMAVMGGSYGGFMTFWTVTQTPRFKAAIGHAGISDWYSFFGQTDIPNLLEFGFGGLPSGIEGDVREVVADRICVARDDAVAHYARRERHARPDSPGGRVLSFAQEDGQDGRVPALPARGARHHRADPPSVSRRRAGEVVRQVCAQRGAARGDAVDMSPART
jgi:dipeptidyl aminopeptidase/acylaminoacyl peptidase